MSEIKNLSFEICYTARKIYQILNKYLKKYNITPEQFVVLEALFEKEEISQKELALILDKDQNTVKAIVDKLEKNDYIKKEVNSKDKRAFKLYLTKKSKINYPLIKSEEEKITSNLLNNIPFHSTTEFSSFLEKMRGNIELLLEEK